MSLAIDIDRISSILLSDGWHEVDDYSFIADAYEFVDFNTRDGGFEDSDKFMALGPGGDGFGFKGTDGNWIYGPVSAILAVKTHPYRESGSND